MKKLLLPALVAAALAGGNCGYNDIQKLDEETKAQWSEVLNQYKRRSDLIPNLVEIVKKYAKHEKAVFVGVAKARSQATSIQATPELLNDEGAFKKFVAAQSQIKGSLSRLMVVAEKYPDLKADKQFLGLQAQLEGTENRIAVARNRYIGSIKEFNVLVRSFPSVVTAKMFGYGTKPNFTVDDEKAISDAPKIKF